MEIGEGGSAVDYFCQSMFLPSKYSVSILGPKNAKKWVNIFCKPIITVFSTMKFGFHHPDITKNSNYIYTGCPISNVGSMSHSVTN